MINRFLTNLCLVGILSGCGPGDNIKIAPDGSQNDTYDPIQDSQEEDDPVPEEETEDTGTDTGPEPDQLTDFSQWGPHYPYGIAKETRAASVTNCPSMEYEVYTPYVDNPPVVVLGHGFARGSGVMTGWAEHLSSWGVEVLLPTLCHYNVFTGVDHEMNGQNMKELADLHGVPNAIYAGHSAGGLAAIIAASKDPTSAGVLGLDATDTQDVPGAPDLIGQQYAADVISPAFSISGEPSSCNANNNGLELFRMMGNFRAVKAISSDHCDFESPTDWVCESQCLNPSVEFTDEEIRPIIITLGTAAIMSLTDLSSDGDVVWATGLEDWENQGIIQELE